MALVKIAGRQVHRDARCLVIGVILYVITNNSLSQFLYVFALVPIPDSARDSMTACSTLS